MSRLRNVGYQLPSKVSDSVTESMSTNMGLSSDFRRWFLISLILATGDLGKAGHAECLKELSWSEGHIGRHPWLEAGGAVACLFFAGLQGGVWPVFLLAFFCLMPRAIGDEGR